MCLFSGPQTPRALDSKQRRVEPNAVMGLGFGVSDLRLVQGLGLWLGIRILDAFGGCGFALIGLATTVVPYCTCKL